ncbi:MAG: hypothetical protein AABY22_13520, partial [Nanoarchaeota archaeon]
RCIFYKGEILSRSLKPIQNKQLRERFEPIRKYSEQLGLIFDGEIFSPKLTFQAITHFVMTIDLGEEILPDHLKFYCFDCLTDEMLPFQRRMGEAEFHILKFKFTEFLNHHRVNSKEEVETLFEKVLEEGYEGLILRDPKGKYKFGRGTLKESIIFKIKPFETFDAQITGVVQSTQVNEDAEKKTNELGRSVTSKKIGERHTIEKASAFWVEYQGKPLKVVLAMTDEEKEEVWKNRNSYIGKFIEYKGMLIGAKSVPRHPVMFRFRKDKE